MEKLSEKKRKVHSRKLNSLSSLRMLLLLPSCCILGYLEWIFHNFLVFSVKSIFSVFVSLLHLLCASIVKFKLAPYLESIHNFVRSHLC